MPLNVNMENLREMHGDKAESVFREICDLGGHGTVGDGPGQVSPHYAGGLGLLGVLREDNTAVSEKDKDRIAKLAGVDRKKDIDNHKGVGLPRTASPPPEEK